MEKKNCLTAEAVIREMKKRGYDARPDAELHIDKPAAPAVFIYDKGIPVLCHPLTEHLYDGIEDENVAADVMEMIFKEMYDRKKRQTTKRCGELLELPVDMLLGRFLSEYTTKAMASYCYRKCDDLPFFELIRFTLDGESFLYLTEEMREKLGISRERLFEIARQNAIDKSVLLKHPTGLYALQGWSSVLFNKDFLREHLELNGSRIIKVYPFHGHGGIAIVQHEDVDHIMLELLAQYVISQLSSGDVICKDEFTIDLDEEERGSDYGC